MVCPEARTELLHHARETLQVATAHGWVSGLGWTAGTMDSGGGGVSRVGQTLGQLQVRGQGAARVLLAEDAALRNVAHEHLHNYRQF